MQKDTAKMLIDFIFVVAGLAFENQCKLAALEKAIQESDPNLFPAYSRILKQVLRNSQPPLYPSSLLEKLIKD